MPPLYETKNFKLSFKGSFRKNGVVYYFYGMKTVTRVKYGLKKISALAGNPNQIISVQSKSKGKDKESIQSSTTPDPGHHMGK